MKYDLVLENIGLIKTVTQKYYDKLKYLKLEYDDLYQAACLSVLENIDRYDESISTIATYIAKYAKYGILKYTNATSTMVSVPRDLRYTAFKLLKENNDFYRKNNRYMNEEEIEEFLKPLASKVNHKFDKEFVDRILFISRYTFNDQCESLDKIYKYEIDDDTINNKRIVFSKSNTEEDAINSIFITELINYLEKLKLKTSEIESFINYYELVDDNYTVDELASKYNISDKAIYKKIQKVKSKIYKEDNSVK